MRCLDKVRHLEKGRLHKTLSASLWWFLLYSSNPRPGFPPGHTALPLELAMAYGLHLV